MTLDIKETIKKMSKEALVEILQKIYDEYPTIRHAFYEAYKEALNEN